MSNDELYRLLSDKFELLETRIEHLEARLPGEKAVALKPSNPPNTCECGVTIVNGPHVCEFTAVEANRAR